MIENLKKMMVVMLRPSMHKAMQKRAAELGMRVSEYVRTLIQADLSKKGK